ncbi:MAG: alpha-hydroxy acid oxidase [Dehalococcoidia bacterium]|nr:alpha-hydroxy acid oxidase [Dehalococcoidia bacterium]
MQSDLISLSDFEAKARRALPQGIWDFIAGGAQDEVTLRLNKEAFQRIPLRPRRPVDITKRDLSVTVLGQKLSFPVMVAPMGVHKMAHLDGELASAKAAGAAGTLMALATGSTYSIEDVAKVATGPLWFQLYFNGREISEFLIRRAEAAGYTAVIVTVDVPLHSPKERDVRNKFISPPGIERANFASLPKGLTLSTAPSSWRRSSSSQSTAQSGQWSAPPVTVATWADIDWLRSMTKLPVLLKGIMTAEDAKLCVEHGVSGVIVSNHGGRQLDCQSATIEVLPEVVQAVGGKAEVYLDSGIRRGSDVLKALALGARAVFTGQPIFWGLAVDGEAGARQVLEILRTELDLAMAFCGRPTIASIDRSVVEKPKEKRGSGGVPQI